MEALLATCTSQSTGSMAVQGVLQSFAPLDMRELVPMSVEGTTAPAYNVLSGISLEMLRNATVQNSPNSRWLRPVERRSRGPLLVAVLGTSTTAGCGSSEFVGSTSSVLYCDVSRSWARRLQMCLQPSISRLLGTSASIHVWAKNAVDVSFFGGCASSRLPGPETDLILLDTTSAWEHSDLGWLFRRLLRAAPHAAIVCVAWPHRLTLNWAAKDQASPMRAKVRCRWRPSQRSVNAMMCMCVCMHVHGRWSPIRVPCDSSRC